MRPVRSRSQGMSVTLAVVLGCVGIPVVACGAIGTLYAFGKIDLPFLKKGEYVPPGTIPVPVGVAVVVKGRLQAIPAYTKLTRENLWDPAKGHLACLYLLPEEIKPEMILEYKKILGRVLKHDKPAGYVFTEKDFLPKDTRAGLSGGTPPGKRALTLDASKIDGLFGLHEGDHVDLLAIVPFDNKGGGGFSGITGGRGGLGGGFQVEAQMARAQKRATVRVLAQDAVLVTQVKNRMKPTISHSLTQGTKSVEIPVQEIVVAVEPDEVALVTEAEATDVKIVCAARSGQPGDPDAETPGYDPLSDLTMIESFHGNNHEFVPLTKTTGLGQPSKANRPEHHHHHDQSSGGKPFVN
jgi:hypothetical protein